MFLKFCSDWLNHNILCADDDQSRLRGFCCTIQKFKKKKTGCAHHQSLKLSLVIPKVHLEEEYHVI